MKRKKDYRHGQQCDGCGEKAGIRGINSNGKKYNKKVLKTENEWTINARVYFGTLNAVPYIININ